MLQPLFLSQWRNKSFISPVKKNSFSLIRLNFLLFLSFCLSQNILQAQVSSYTVAQSNAAYAAIGGGTVHGTSNNDDQNFNAINIGFNFNYNCINYTQISIQSNGFIAFGNTVSSSFFPISTGATNNIVTALGHNMIGNGVTSVLRSQLIGTAPNRVFVIQWVNYQSSGSIDNYNFQIRLRETSNIIELHYGAFTKSVTNKTVEVGLRGSSNVDFNNRRVLSGTNSWATSTAGLANTHFCDLRIALVPATGQKYTFTPNPTAMTFNSSTAVDVALAGNVEICEFNVPMTRVEIVVAGCVSPMNLTQLLVNITGTAPVATVSRVHVYYTGNSPVFSTVNEFVTGGMTPAAALIFTSTQVLSAGTNYFWITYDFNNTGIVGNTIGADMPNNSLTVGGVVRNPTASPNCLKTYIACPAFPSNPSLWLKANASTSTTVHGNTVTSWGSSGSVVLSVIQAPAGRRPLFQDGAGSLVNNRFNYNPFLLFDGVDDNLEVVGSFNLGNGNSGFGLSTFQVIGQTSGIVALDWKGPNGDVKLKGDGLFAISNELGTLGTSNQFIDQTSPFNAHLASIRGAIDGVIGRYNGELRASSSNSIPNGAATNKLCIGRNVNAGEHMSGGMGEFIFFPSVLSVSSNLRIESYLGIKYGITLGSATIPSDYLSSTGAQIWVGDAAYQNNIIGIGRDDNSLLVQKQSHNYDDTVRIYKGSLATTNIGNTSTFASNQSYVVAGANLAAMNSTAISLTEMPVACSLYSRLGREWKIKKTNMGELFSMDFKLSPNGAPGSVNISHLRLLVDDDGDFSNGGTSCYLNGDGSGITFSYSNPVITLTGISNTHIPNNSTRFITIASTNILTPLPVELLDFTTNLNEKRTVDLLWSTATETNNDYFVIEKSAEIGNWVEIATIDGAGNSNSIQNYSFEDKYPLIHNNYYRLKQVDFDGNYKYSDIRYIDLKASHEYLVYPNPAQTYFIVQSSKIASTEIKLFNSYGQQMMLSFILLSEDAIQFQIEGLNDGLYYIQIKAGTEITIKKLFVKG